MNRFAALMFHAGAEVIVHVANSGRLEELLHPDNGMLIAPAQSGSSRKTVYDLVLVEVGGVLVSADARLPNRLLRDAIESGSIAEFRGYENISAEVTFGRSRLDLKLSGKEGECYVEAKSVTLVEEGEGLFPDAPTLRGRKHLHSLAEAAQAGHRAAVVFVVQRPDVWALRSNNAADPEFWDTLREVGRQGVEAFAYRCRVSRQEVTIAERVPLQLT